MKYSIYFAASVLFLLSSCEDDDTSWKQEIASLKQELTEQKSLLQTLEQNAYVVGVDDYTDHYTINFSNGQSVTLYNGQSPEITIGTNGNWYINGVDTGKSSQGKTTILSSDSATPLFSIGTNGHWYIDGEDTGVVAEGKNGADAPFIESVVMQDNTFTFNFSDNTSVSCLAQISNSDVYGLPVLSNNPLQSVNYTAGFASIFKTWGFIGDSFASGEMAYFANSTDSTMTYTDMYEYSWGQRLCSLCGSEGYNFSKGGMTTHIWLNVDLDRCWAGAKNNPKQAYIIALGYNDFHCNLATGDLKTDVDLSNYNNNKESYAGNMAGIIQRVKSVSPDAFFFCVTLPAGDKTIGTDYDGYNEVIRQLPTYFSNVYVIDLYKYAPAYDDAFHQTYFLNNHMSAAGYQYTAYMFATYIDWIVRKNPADFVSVALVNNK